MKILITGSGGQLAKEFIRVFTARGIACSAPPESECDITGEDTMRARLDEESPTVLINCAAYNAVDRAEDEPETAMRVNAESPGMLARVARDAGILFVHYSSDYVFDGTRSTLYTEDDPPAPLNIYGKSKLRGEELVRESGGDCLIFRTSWVYGEGQQNFLYKLSEWARAKDTLSITTDEVSIPTSTRLIVELTVAALDKKLRGLYHLVASGCGSRFDVAREYTRLKKIPVTIRPCSIDDFDLPARRPKHSAMSNARLARDLGVTIPDWRDELALFV
jgi:dTDP-4-dehydrorhamnose reductase